MQKDSTSLTHLTDEQLLLEVKALAARERQATTQLIASLAELDARRLYLGEGFSSLFTYCTQCLRLSEHAAYNRIEAARAARKWPVILEMLADGSITLTTVCLLASHLTSDNHGLVLNAARYKSKREVEQQVAALRPLPPVPSSVRKLPAPKPVVVPQPASVSSRRGVNHWRRRMLRTRRTWSSARPRRRVAPRSWRHSRRSVTRGSSPSARRPTTSFAVCRISCGTRSRTVIPRLFSIVLSRCSWRIWRERSWPKLNARERSARPRQDRGTFRQPSNVRCGGVMGDSAPSSEPWAAASNAGSSNFTTWSRSPRAERRQARTCSSAAAPTTCMKPSDTSGCCY